METKNLDTLTLEKVESIGMFLIVAGAMRALVSRQGQYAPAVAMIGSGLAAIATAAHLGRK